MADSWASFDNEWSEFTDNLFDSTPDFELIFAPIRNQFPIAYDNSHITDAFDLYYIQHVGLEQP